jgi:hypothetical protein
MVRRGYLTSNGICGRCEQLVNDKTSPVNYRQLRETRIHHGGGYSLYMKITVFWDVTPCSLAEIYWNAVFQN